MKLLENSKIKHRNLRLRFMSFGRIRCTDNLYLVECPICGARIYSLWRGRSFLLDLCHLMKFEECPYCLKLFNTKEGEYLLFSLGSHVENILRRYGMPRCRKKLILDKEIKEINEYEMELRVKKDLSQQILSYYQERLEILWKKLKSKPKSKKRRCKKNQQ